MNLVYRFFFRTYLPLIVQTFEFDNFFEHLEGSDADQINAQFREVVQESLRGKKLVASHQCTRTSIETEDEDDDDDSADLDYEPDDDQLGDEEMEDEEGDDKEEEDDTEGYEIESGEESSDEEEEFAGAITGMRLHKQRVLDSME
jgi:hypothetical protein